MSNNIAWILVLIIALYISQSQTPTPTENTQIITPPTSNYNSYIDSGISFNAQDKFLSGTSLSTESVRIIKTNGVVADLGYKSLNGGTLATEPGDNYRIYYFMNGTTPSNSYYSYVEEYTAPPIEATQAKIGYGCQVDTSPIFTSITSSNQVQSSTSNAQAVSANSVVEMTVKVKVHSNKCYGTPNASKQNAICFTLTGFSNVNANSGSVSQPRSMAALGAMSCYNLPLLENLDVAEIPVTLTSGATEPTVAHNITVYSDDIGLDLDGTDLHEIWDFTDEKGNNLGTPTYQTLGKIYIS